jgi:hypothetical protein
MLETDLHNYLSELESRLTVAFYAWPEFAWLSERRLRNFSKDAGHVSICEQAEPCETSLQLAVPFSARPEFGALLGLAGGKCGTFLEMPET